MNKNKLISNRAKFDQKAIKLLFQTIPKLKNNQQSEIFLRDLMSSSEIKDLARRLLAVQMLYNKKTYSEVNFRSDMSMGTINKMHFKTKGSKILHNFLS